MTDTTTTPTTSATTTKPGYKTTEFWLALAATLLSILFAAGVLTSGSTWDKVFALVATALTSAGYSVSRGTAKAAA